MGTYLLHSPMKESGMSVQSIMAEAEAGASARTKAAHKVRRDMLEGIL